MAKRRILYCIDSLKMGGAERITVALLPFMHDIEPIICTLYDHESPLTERLGDIKHIHLGASRLADPMAIARFDNILRQEKIDLIHAQLIHGTVMSSIAGMTTGTPLVITRHVVEDDLSSKKKRRMVSAEKIASKRADRIIYVSDAQRQRHLEYYDFDKDKTRVIYNGLDLSRFDGESSPPMPVDGSRPIILMVGVVRPGKGHPVAIDAARLVPDADFLLVGDGDEDLFEQYQAQAKDLDNVYFLGTRSDVPDLMMSCDLVILPSDIEALPTVLIEAGAASKASVATRVGGIPEIILDGETGILIDPRDSDGLAKAIQTLLDKPAMLETMGQKARKHIEAHFSLEGQSATLTALYEEVLSEH
ncbi:MAG: glycosyltransferase family 4 protein [Phototrophicaceae bacterium]